MKRRLLYVVVAIMVVTAFCCLWYIPAQFSYRECVKQSSSNYKCYLDTFKMIRCPTSTRVPGAESMTSTGFRYKSGDDAVTTP